MKVKLSMLTTDFLADDGAALDHYLELRKDSKVPNQVRKGQK